MSKILITGANGFLGSWLCRHLCAQNHEVHALIRKSSDLSELEGLPIKYSYGDITDLESIKQASKGIDSVFHLAGLIAYKSSEREKMEHINVQGTANVIEALQTTGVRRLVHLSSVVAVGAGFQPTEILNEESSYNVSHLNLGYFETKHKAEKLVIDAVRTKKIDAVILNPSTIYGPGDAKKGSRKTQLKVAQGVFPFYTSGGVSVVHIEDVIQGILSAWNKGRSGERYILSGENISIKQLFQIIAAEAGVKAPPLYLPNFLLHGLGSVGDILTYLGKNSSLSKENAWTASLYHWFDSTKAQTELDFSPRPAKIAISQSVRWMKENQLLR